MNTRHAACLVLFACISAAPAVASDVSPSFSGTGRALVFGETDDARASISASDSARALQRLRGATAKTGGAETVFGNDQRKRVNPTTTFPARATVHILFKQGSALMSCSGFLISANTVVTAGRCVAPGGTGQYNKAATYEIFPGNNGHAPPPYGSCKAKKLYAVQAWLNHGTEEHNYGAIKLDCNIGNTTGWWAYYWKAELALKTAVTVQGYPLDKGEFTQWKASDKLRAVETSLVFHQADTYFGQEGSPIWTNDAAPFCSGVCVLGINSGGPSGSTPPLSKHNHGTRITQAVFNNLNTWKSAP